MAAAGLFIWGLLTLVARFDRTDGTRPQTPPRITRPKPPTGQPLQQRPATEQHLSSTAKRKARNLLLGSSSSGDPTPESPEGSLKLPPSTRRELGPNPKGNGVPGQIPRIKSDGGPPLSGSTKG